MQTEAKSPRITDAGFKLIRAYVETAQNSPNRLAAFVRFVGDDVISFRALRLSAGDGGAKAAAMKLARDGFGECHWASFRRVRCFVPNDAAIWALQSASVEV